MTDPTPGQAAAVEAEVRPHERGPGTRRWLRTSVVSLFVVLTCLSFTAAVPGVWARRNVLDSDRFVSRVGPLAAEPAVQEVLALRLTEQLMLLIDPRELFEEVLPERGQLLAAPLANAVEGFVHDRVEAFVATDTFAELWEAAARVAHESSVTLLRGRSSDVVTVADGRVALDFLPAIDALLHEITSVSPEILGREIDIPDLGVEDIPTQAIPLLENALGVTLDDDFGQVTIYDEDELAAAQEGVRLFDRLVVVLLPLAAGFAGLALWLSRRRRRTLLQLAGGVTVGMVLIRRVAFGLEDDIAALPPTEAGAKAVAVAVDTLLDPLSALAGWSLGAALLVAIAALLTGSYPWVMSLRRRVVGLARSVASAGARGRDEEAVAWVTTNRDALLVGGVVVGLLLLWTTDLSWLGLLLVLGLVAVYEVVIHRIGTSTQTRQASPSR